LLYVLDASVVIKWLVPGLLSDRAERFIAAFRAGQLDFIMGSFHDALYLSLAFERDRRLLTADERMVRAFARIDRLVPLAAAPDPLEVS